MTDTEAVPQEVETEIEATPSMEETAAAAFDAAVARETEEAQETEIAEEAPTGEKAPARGPDGKFLAAEGTKPSPAETKTTDAVVDTSSEAATPIAGPVSMSAADKAEFSKLPPAMQAFVLRRENDVNRSLTQKTQELSQRSKQYDQLDQVLGPRRQQFAMMGVSPAQAIDQLMALSDYATRDLPGFLQYMAQQRGFDLRTLIPAEGQQQQQPVDPTIANLQRQLGETRQILQSITTGQQDYQQQQINSEIDNFRNAKAPDGNPKFPHFESVRVSMGALMQAGQADDLESAYDMAVNASPSIRAQLQAEQRAADEVKRQTAERARVAKAKQAQGTVLTPKGTTPGKPRAKSMEETAREAYERVNGAVAS